MELKSKLAQNLEFKSLVPSYDECLVFITTFEVVFLNCNLFSLFPEFDLLSTEIQGLQLIVVTTFYE